VHQVGFSLHNYIEMHNKQDIRRNQNFCLG